MSLLPKRVLGKVPRTGIEIDDPAFYTVYLVASVGMPREHHAIFVQENGDSAGRVYQVTSNIQSGISFKTKRTGKPEESAEF